MEQRIISRKGTGRSTGIVYILIIALFSAFVTNSCEKYTTDVKPEDDPLSVTDITPPVISSVTPENSAVSVATSAKATVTFSEKMNAGSITSSTITLKHGSTLVTGTVLTTGAVAVFTPSSTLTGNTLYTGTVTTGVKDSTGNALAAEYTWSFTTAATADVTPPTVLSVVPASNATSVATGTKVTATFSETMDAATISASTFTLKQGSTAVAGTISYTGTSATFTPSAALTGSTSYTATITTGAKDPSGNALTANYTWTFTTIAAAAGKSFSTDVVPILNLCNTCHTHSWTTSTNASTFYTNLVNSGHVKPSAPTSSKIYVKLNGGHPPSTVSAAQVTTILTWMTEGSKNN
jgi:hypothetical protein